MSLSTLIILALIARVINGHSWLVCTDYVTKNDDYYNVSKCRGWPRSANLKIPQTVPFGADTGFDHIPNDKNPCQVTRDDSKHYDASHPMAVYYPGQQVVLAHPMKNHGADVFCTNKYIPDNGNFIYSSSVNEKVDPTLSEFKKKLIFDLGISPTGNSASAKISYTYPKPGYQNAAKFCEDNDKSLGTYSFNVPNNLVPGRYTFIWLWAFNSAHDLYSTCFEVDIVKNVRARNARLQENKLTDFSEPCGGNTSNPEIKGNCNGRSIEVTLKTTPISKTTFKPKTFKIQTTKEILSTTGSGSCSITIATYCFVFFLIVSVQFLL